jgi:putative FmdB family regulatory protein
MPTYAYKCTACGTSFDVVQSFSDPALTVHEDCGGALRKLFSPVGVTFNGSGFYRTDSRSKPAAASTDSGSSSSSGSDAGSSSGSGSGSSSSGSGSGSSSSGSGSGSSSSGSSSAPASTGASS